MSESAEALMAMGYRRTSGRHSIVSRIDRPDWEEVAREHGVIGGTQAQVEDWYRRVLSQDNLQTSEVKNVRTSGNDTTGYIPMTNDKLIKNIENSTKQSYTKAEVLSLLKSEPYICPEYTPGVTYVTDVNTVTLAGTTLVTGVLFTPYEYNIVKHSVRCQIEHTHAIVEIALDELMRCCSPAGREWYIDKRDGKAYKLLSDTTAGVLIMSLLSNGKHVKKREIFYKYFLPVLGTTWRFKEAICGHPVGETITFDNVGNDHICSSRGFYVYLDKLRNYLEPVEFKVDAIYQVARQYVEGTNDFFEVGSYVKVIYISCGVLQVHNPVTGFMNLDFKYAAKCLVEAPDLHQYYTLSDVSDIQGLVWSNGNTFKFCGCNNAKSIIFVTKSAFDKHYRPVVGKWRCVKAVGQFSVGSVINVDKVGQGTFSTGNVSGTFETLMNCFQPVIDNDNDKIIKEYVHPVSGKKYREYTDGRVEYQDSDGKWHRSLLSGKDFEIRWFVGGRDSDNIWAIKPDGSIWFFPGSGEHFRRSGHKTLEALTILERNVRATDFEYVKNHVKGVHLEFFLCGL